MFSSPGGTCPRSEVLTLKTDRSRGRRHILRMCLLYQDVDTFHLSSLRYVTVPPAPPAQPRPVYLNYPSDPNKHCSAAAASDIIRKLSVGTIILHAVFFMICIIVTFTQCTPVQKLWDATGTVQATCINATAFFYSKRQSPTSI